MKIFWYLLISCTVYLRGSYAGVMHTHHHEISKERESDGGYVKHAKEHFSNNDGEHNSEFDHEAIIGSYKEAEEYDKLSPEESRQKLAALVKKMDKNKDDNIDKEELKIWILRSFRLLAEEEAEERFEDADWDNDGQLTWNEYLADTFGVESEEHDHIKLHEDSSQFVSEDKEMWKAADKNADGILNSEEFVKFVSPEDYPELIPVMLKQTLRSKDKDGDNGINFEEFINERGPAIDQSDMMAEKTRFLEFDKDKDGKLMGLEIMSWIVPNNDEIAEEEVDHLYASADDNKDGVLSFHEILNHYDVFVGSEVTDYGDHLYNLHKFEDEL